MFLLIGLLVFTACGASADNSEPTQSVAQPAPEPTPTPQISPDPTLALSELMKALRAAGGAVELSADTVAPIVHPRPGRVLFVNGQRLVVFEYGTLGETDKAALSIPADGLVEAYAAPPHFYREGVLLVLYVGEDAALLGLLNQVLGLPFAGASRPTGQCGAWHTHGAVSASLAPSFCVVWSDPFEDETGFRVTVTYNNTQETFTHEVGPDTIELLLPEAEAAAPGDCQRWSSHTLEVVALRPEGETPLGMLATDSGCDQVSYSAVKPLCGSSPINRMTTTCLPPTRRDDCRKRTGG